MAWGNPRWKLVKSTVSTTLKLRRGLAAIWNVVHDLIRGKDALGMFERSQDHILFASSL